MKKNKILKILLSIFLFIYLFYYLGNLVAPGHYPNAETYKLNIKEEDFLLIIKKFKISNSQYNLPKERSKEIRDIDSNNLYKFVRFFYPLEKYTIYTAFSEYDWNKKKTELILIAIDTCLENYGSYYFNESFPNKKMNNDEIEKFENRILKPLKVMIKNYKQK